MLTELRRIVESMAEANTLEQALQALVSQTRLAMTVDCCSVYVAEPDMRRYRLAATDGLAESAEQADAVFWYAPPNLGWDLGATGAGATNATQVCDSLESLFDGVKALVRPGSSLVRA